MCLVVKQSAFFSRAFLISKLLSAHRISGGYQDSSVHEQTHRSDQVLAGVHHYLIDSSNVSLDFEVSLCSDFSELAEHVETRDADIIEHQPSVIVAISSQLGSNVAYSDSRHRFASFSISDLDHENLNSDRVSIEDKVSEYCRIVSPPAHTSRPVLSGGQGWRVNYEAISSLVKSSGSFKASHI